MKNRSNLKRLFLYNFLLLVLVVTVFYYSMEISEHSDETVFVQQTITLNEDSNEISSPMLEPVKKPLEARPFTKEALTVYETPYEMYDIPFKSVFDREVKLSDYRGSWVFLNLWATWCPPCLVEMPSLQGLQDLYIRKNVKVIAVALDREMTGQKLSAFLTKRGLGPVAAYYGSYSDVKDNVIMRGLPTSYIINPQGQVVAMYQSHTDWTGEKPRAFINALLAEEQHQTGQPQDHNPQSEK